MSDPHASNLFLRIAPSGDGSGVFAARDIPAGILLGTFTGTKTDQPTRLSLQVDQETHIEPDEDCPLAFLNHACEPTCAFRGRELFALRSIARGGELTIDYNCHEADMTAPFQCLCGAPSCVGRVSGWRYLDEKERVKRRGRIAPWLSGTTSARANDRP